MTPSLVRVFNHGDTVPVTKEVFPLSHLCKRRQTCATNGARIGARHVLSNRTTCKIKHSVLRMCCVMYFSRRWTTGVSLHLHTKTELLDVFPAQSIQKMRYQQEQWCFVQGWGGDSQNGPSIVKGAGSICFLDYFEGSMHENFFFCSSLDGALRNPVKWRHAKPTVHWSPAGLALVDTRARSPSGRGEPKVTLLFLSSHKKW